MYITMKRKSYVYFLPTFLYLGTLNLPPLDLRYTFTLEFRFRWGKLVQVACKEVNEKKAIFI
jgi:hypothetical protein